MSLLTTFKRFEYSFVGLFLLLLSALPVMVGSSMLYAASPNLTDAAPGTGLSIVQRTWSASVVDYNNDGLDDVWLGFHQRVDSQLMRNNGDGTFTWVARDAWHRANAVGEPIDRHDCTWGDFDKNGLQDAVCSVGRDAPNHVKGALDDNEVWLQTADGQFTDVGTEWGIGDPCGRGRHLAVADYNKDGWLDVFVGNDKPRGTVGDPCDDPTMGLPNSESKMFINQGGQGFAYDPAWGTTRPAAGIGCALALDVNKDGWMDLYACNYRTSKPNLYINTGTGTFTDQTTKYSLGTATDAVTGDINNDGIEDLIISDVKVFGYKLGTPTGLGSFVRIHTTSASNIAGWGVAVGDINSDGKTDIYGLVHDLNLTTNPDDVMFLNNGNLTFTKLTPPSASGNADSVNSLRLYSNAPNNFLVQNGREKMAGPVQLVAYLPF